MRMSQKTWLRIGVVAFAVALVGLVGASISESNPAVHAVFVTVGDLALGYGVGSITVIGWRAVRQRRRR